MNIYYLVFIWIAVMAFFSSNVDVTQKTVLHGNIKNRWKMVYAFIAILPLLYIVVFTQPRSDVPLYLSGYNRLPTSFEGLKTTLDSSDSGQGFVVFEWIIKNITGGSETAFRFILFLFHSIPILYLYRKYSDNYLLSLYLFAASGSHIGWMMNGLRQFLAVSIILLATPFIIKKKYWLSLIFILLAVTIHTSAIIMIPIIFIVQGKPWNKRTLLFIIFAVAMMYLFGRNSGMLDGMLENTEYSGLMETAKETGDDGVNPIRVLVNSIPMILSLIGKKQIERDDNPVINVCVNMSVITTGVYLVGMVTSGIMIGRLPVYTDLYSFILLPYETERIFNKETSKMIKIMMIVFYFAYYLYAYRGY